MTEEVKALHKKWVPANIIMAIAGFVAAICTLFMPWLDLRLSINPKELSNMLLETGAQARTESVYQLQSAAGDDDDAENIDGVMKSLAKSIGDLPEDALTFPVNIYPMKLLSAATGTEHDVAEFIVSLVGKNGIVEHMKAIVSNLIPVFATTIVNGTIDSAVNDALANSDLSEEDKAAVKEALGVHTDKVGSVITTLTGTADTPSNPEKAKEDFKQLVSDINNDPTMKEKLPDFEIPEEDLDEVFDALVEAGTNEEGVFDINSLLANIENLDIGGSTGEGTENEGDPSDEGDEGDPISPSKAMISLMNETDGGEFDFDEPSEDTENSADDLQDILDLLNDPAAGLENLLKDSGIDMQTLQPILIGVFFVLMGLPALCWLLFAIFATLHIFTEKKKTATWYVKFFGFISFSTVLMLNIMPAVMTSVLGSALGSAGASNIVSIKFLGSGVVVAACYVVLVLLGWFYYKPLNKKIKVAMQAAKLAAANGYPVQPVAPIAPTVVNVDEDEYLEEEPTEETKEVIEAPAEETEEIAETSTEEVEEIVEAPIKETEEVIETPTEETEEVIETPTEEAEQKEE